MDDEDTYVRHDYMNTATQLQYMNAGKSIMMF